MISRFTKLLKIAFTLGLIFSLLGTGTLVGLDYVTEESLFSTDVNGHNETAGTPSSASVTSTPTETERETPTRFPEQPQSTETETTTKKSTISQTQTATPTATSSRDYEAIPDDVNLKNVNKSLAQDVWEERISDSWDSRTDPDDPFVSTAVVDGQKLNSYEVEYYIFEKVNEIRAERGLPKYDYSAYLSSISRAHSKDMQVNRYFSHQNRAGENIWNRFGSDWQSHCKSMSENIASNWAGGKVDTDWGGERTFNTNEELAEALVQQWMHSEGHREAILNADNDVMGVGVYIGNESNEYDGYVPVKATQGFCDNE